MKWNPMRGRTPGALVAVSAVMAAALWAASSVDAAESAGRLFPRDLPEPVWSEFKADGFSQPVAGVIYGTSHPTCCGVALGGLGTGSLDIETSGVLGFCTFFPAPRRQSSGMVAWYRNPQLLMPFLGLAVGSRTWVLTTQKYLDGGLIQGCTEPGNAIERKLKDDPVWLAHWQTIVPRTEGVEPVRDIHYWGHFPVADLEYETDSPVSVGLRAWAPFIPGDPIASNMPGAVFEVRLRNTADSAQRGTLAFSFPGPTQTQTAYTEFVRTEVQEDFHAVTVSSLDGEIGYAVAVLGPEKARFGAGLSASPTAWSRLRHVLPPSHKTDPGTSVAVDFKLRPGEKKVVRIILAWYASHWQGGTLGDYGLADPGAPKTYAPMYASRYPSALDVVGRLAKDHASLLRRVLAWQEAIYSSHELPAWLRDCLVNNLNLIAKVSSWAQPDEELGDWSFPDGAFGLNESPRSCSMIGCIASNWYGDLPICYFFPQLERAFLRSQKALMREDGAVAFFYPTGDWTRGFYEAQMGLNGPCFVDLVDRLWRRTGDDEILRELYPAVKKNTTFTMTMKPGPEGVIRLPKDGRGQEWWEHTDLFGMVTHLGGMRLSTLRIAERMAEKMGDEEFARQCRQWLDGGSRVLEEQLWNDEAGSYLLYRDPETGKQSDLILSAQLDGDWAAVFHGLPGVFGQDRARTVLDTVRRTCVTDYGFVGFASPEEGAQLGAYGSFSAENHIVAMTYMYQGQRDFGLEMVRRFMENIVLKQRHTWDLPNMITCDTGERFFGTDYFQNMMLWALPAALQGTDLTGPCRPGGLVDRVLQAAGEM